MAIFSEPTTHPSYGTITLSRISGSGMSLFGSSIKHSTAICLRISRAELNRDLHQDWIFSKDQIVEIRMSPVQFSEFVMSAGQGDGVPCTIKHIAGEGMIPDPISKSKREQFTSEFANRMATVGKKLDDAVARLDELFKQPSVTKAERAAVRDLISQARSEVVSNMPFVASQFNEQMDKTIHEAKGEVEAFVSGVVQRSGLAAIQRGEIALE